MAWKAGLIHALGYRQHHPGAHVLRPETRLTIPQGGIDKLNFAHDLFRVLRLKIRGVAASVSSNRPSIRHAWSAGIQIDMDVSGGVLANLDAGGPCRHDGDLHLVSWRDIKS